MTTSFIQVLYDPSYSPPVAPLVEGSRSAKALAAAPPLPAQLIGAHVLPPFGISAYDAENEPESLPQWWQERLASPSMLFDTCCGEEAGQHSADISTAATAMIGQALAVSAGHIPSADELRRSFAGVAHSLLGTSEQALLSAAADLLGTLSRASSDLEYCATLQSAVIVHILPLLPHLASIAHQSSGCRVLHAVADALLAPHEEPVVQLRVSQLSLAPAAGSGASAASTVLRGVAANMSKFFASLQQRQEPGTVQQAASSESQGAFALPCLSQAVQLPIHAHTGACVQHVGHPPSSSSAVLDAASRLKLDSPEAQLLHARLMYCGHSALGASNPLVVPASIPSGTSHHWCRLMLAAQAGALVHAAQAQGPFLPAFVTTQAIETEVSLAAHCLEVVIRCLPCSLTVAQGFAGELLQVLSRLQVQLTEDQACLWELCCQLADPDATSSAFDCLAAQRNDTASTLLLLLAQYWPADAHKCKQLLSLATVPLDGETPTTGATTTASIHQRSMMGAALALLCRLPPSADTTALWTEAEQSQSWQDTVHAAEVTDTQSSGMWLLYSTVLRALSMHLSQHPQHAEPMQCVQQLLAALSKLVLTDVHLVPHFLSLLLPESSCSKSLVLDKVSPGGQLTWGAHKGGVHDWGGPAAWMLRCCMIASPLIPSVLHAMRSAAGPSARVCCVFLQYMFAQHPGASHALKAQHGWTTCVDVCAAIGKVDHALAAAVLLSMSVTARCDLTKQACCWSLTPAAASGSELRLYRRANPNILIAQPITQIDASPPSGECESWQLSCGRHGEATLDCTPGSKIVMQQETAATIVYSIVPGMSALPVQMALHFPDAVRIAILRRMTHIVQCSAGCAEAMCTQTNLHSLLSALPNVGTESLSYVTYLLVALLEYRCSPRDVAMLLMLTLLPTAAITALRIETKANKKAIAAKAARFRAEREAAALSSASDLDVSPSHKSAPLNELVCTSQQTVAAKEELQLQLLFILGRLLESVQPPARYTWLEQPDSAVHLTPLRTDTAALPTPTITLCMWCRPAIEATAVRQMRLCTVSLGDVQLLLDLVPVDVSKLLYSAKCSIFSKHEGTWQQCAAKTFSGTPLKLQGDWHHLGVSIGLVHNSRGVSVDLVHWLDGKRSESASQLLAPATVDIETVSAAFSSPAQRGPVTSLVGSAGDVLGVVGGVASAVCVAGRPTAPFLQDLMLWPTKASVTVHSELDALDAICTSHGQIMLAALLDGSDSRSSSAASSREMTSDSSAATWFQSPPVHTRDNSGQHTRCSLVDSLLRGIKLGEERVASILQTAGHSPQEVGAGNLGLAMCLLPIMASSSRTQSASLRLIAQMLAVDGAGALGALGRPPPDFHSMYHWWDSNTGFAALEYLLLSQLQRGRAKFAAYQNSIVEAASAMNPDDASPFSTSQPSVLPHRQVLSVLWNKEVFTELFNMMKAGEAGYSCATQEPASGRHSGAASTSSSVTGSVSTASKQSQAPRKGHKSSNRNAIRLFSGCALQTIIGLLPFCDACIITGMSTLVQSSAAFEQPVLSIVSGMEDVQAQVADSIAEALTEDRHSIDAWFAAARTPHPLPNGSDAVPGLTEAHARNNEDGPGIGRLLDMVRLAYPHLLPPSPLSDASLVPTEEISLLSRGNRRIRTPLLVALRKVLLRKQSQASGGTAYGTVSQGELQVLFDYICSCCSIPSGSSPAASGELAALTDVVNCVLVTLMSPGGEVLLASMKHLSQGLWTIPLVLMDCAVPAVRCSGLRLLSILLQRPGLAKEADAFIVAGGVEAVAAVLAKWTISGDIVQTLIGLIAGFFRVGVVPEAMRTGAPTMNRERSSGSLGNASDHTSRRYNSWHHGSELQFAQPYFLSCLLMLLSVCRDHEIVLRSLSDLERAVSTGRTSDAHENVSAWLATHGWFRQLASFEAAWRDGGLASNSWLNRLGPAVVEGANMAAEEPTKLPGAGVSDGAAFEPLMGAFSPQAVHTDEGSTVSSSLLEGDVVHATSPTEDTHSPDFAAMRNRTYSRERLESHGGSRVSGHASGKPGSADGSDGGRGFSSGAAFDRAHSVELHDASGAISVDGSLSHDAFGSGSASDVIVQRVHSVLKQLLLFDLQYRSSETTSPSRSRHFRENSTVTDAFGAGAGWHDVIKCVDNPGFQIAALRDVLQGLQAEPELHPDTCALFGRNFSKLIRSCISLLGHSLPPALHVHMVGVINLITMRNAPEVRQKLSLSGLMAARDLVTVSLLQRCGHDLDVVAEAVAALEPAFESVSMSCSAAVKECGGVYRLLHLVLIATCAAEMDLAAVLLRICGQLARSSDDAARTVSKCTEHPYLLAQLFRGMEVPASNLGAGGSWMSMTSWRYGSTAAAAAALMHSADDPGKRQGASSGAALVQSTDDFLQWLRPLLLGSNTDGTLVAAATGFASRVQDGFNTASVTTEKTESKLQLSRGKAIRARIDKVTQQRRKTAAQVHAIARQMATEVLSSRRRENFRLTHREAQRRVRLAQGRQLWKGSKAIVSRMMQNEVILGVDLQPQAVSTSAMPSAVVAVRPSSVSGSARASAVLSGSELELDAATRSLPGLRRVKVARVRTSTKSSTGSLSSSKLLESAEGDEASAFDFDTSWGKFVDILLH